MAKPYDRILTTDKTTVVIYSPESPASPMPWGR